MDTFTCFLLSAFCFLLQGRGRIGILVHEAGWLDFRKHIGIRLPRQKTTGRIKSSTAARLLADRRSAGRLLKRTRPMEASGPSEQARKSRGAARWNGRRAPSCLASEQREDAMRSEDDAIIIVGLDNRDLDCRGFLSHHFKRKAKRTPSQNASSCGLPSLANCVSNSIRRLFTARNEATSSATERAGRHLRVIGAGDASAANHARPSIHPFASASAADAGSAGGDVGASTGASSRSERNGPIRVRRDPISANELRFSDDSHQRDSVLVEGDAPRTTVGHASLASDGISSAAVQGDSSHHPPPCTRAASWSSP